jgi:hypothetical protein
VDPSPPLFSAVVCSVAASMAAIDLMLVYRAVPAWPTRVGLGHHRHKLRDPDQPGFPNAPPVTQLLGLMTAYGSCRSRTSDCRQVRAGPVDRLPRRPFHFSHRIQFAARLVAAGAARADGLPAPSGGLQRLTRHWAHRRQVTRPSRRIPLASLPYPLMTVSPWIRLDRFEERMFVCRITLSKAAKCPFCLF